MAHAHPRPHGHAPFPPEPFDPMDPHGFHPGGDHGHVIIPAKVLLNILLLLLAFTILTVAASRGEGWFSHAFNVTIPQWVNVAVALSIAVVKSVLVALFFMQLKYDNPLNGLIFLFCLFAVGLFLGFSMLDLHSRDSIYAWKKGQIVAGGTGNLSRGALEYVPAENTIGYRIAPVTEENDKGFEVRKAQSVVGPIVGFSRTLAEGPRIDGGLGAADFLHAEHLAHHAAAASISTSANATRPRFGTTPGLFGATPPADDDHGAHDQPHDGHATDEAHEPAADGHAPAPSGGH